MSTDSRRLAGSVPADQVLARDVLAGDRPRQHRPEEGAEAASGPVPSWLRFFKSELRLVFGRPRNLALLGVLALVPIFFGVVFRLTLGAPTGPGNGQIGRAHV